MPHPSTFDFGALTRCSGLEPAGDLGDVWDTTPDAVALILDGPRKVEVSAEHASYQETT